MGYFQLWRRLCWVKADPKEYGGSQVPEIAPEHKISLLVEKPPQDRGKGQLIRSNFHFNPGLDLF